MKDKRVKILDSEIMDQIEKQDKMIASERGKCSECDKPVPDDMEICVSCYRKYRRKLAKEALEKIKNE